MVLCRWIAWSAVGGQHGAILRRRAVCGPVTVITVRTELWGRTGKGGTGWRGPEVPGPSGLAGNVDPSGGHRVAEDRRGGRVPSGAAFQASPPHRASLRGGSRAVCAGGQPCGAPTLDALPVPCPRRGPGGIRWQPPVLVAAGPCLPPCPLPLGVAGWPRRPLPAPALRLGVPSGPRARSALTDSARVRTLINQRQARHGNKAGFLRRLLGLIRPIVLGRFRWQENSPSST